MIFYAIYNDDGAIIQTGRTGKMTDAEATAARLGGSVYVGLVMADRHKIVDGVLVEIEPAPEE